MSQRLALLLLALGTIGLVAWILIAGGAGDEGRTEATARAASPLVDSVGADGTSTDTGSLQVAPTVETEESAADVPEEPARTAALGAYEQELADGLWVAGRIVFPPGTPDDSRPRITARGRKFQHGPSHEVEVAPDGTFRVAFAPKSRRISLKLKDRWLVMRKSRSVKFSEWDGAPIVLEPELGGAFRARLVIPDDDPGLADLARTASVRVSGQVIEEDSGRVTYTGYSVPLDGELSHVFRALPCPGPFTVQVESDAFVEVRSEEVTLEPGQVAEVELSLRRGVRVSGRVVDEQGDPVEGVEIHAYVRPTGSGMWSSRNTATAPDGSFDVAGLAPGRVEIDVTEDGWVSPEVEPLELANGESRADLELVVARGRGVAGRVVWPDGTPAAKVRVAVQVQPEVAQARASTAGWDYDRIATEVKTNDAGEFEATGLDLGPYDVVAVKGRREVVEEPADAPKRKFPKKQHRNYRATVRGVTTGTTDLVIELSQGLTLTGRVVDDTGTPVERFRVHADSDGDSDRFFFGSGQDIERSFRSKDGTFALEGFEEGPWYVLASAKGHGDSGRQLVEVTGGTGPVKLVVPRVATVAGVVRDASGAPVVGARVNVQDEELAGYSFDIDFGIHSPVSTDEEGRFRFEDVPPGSVRLIATARGFADFEGPRLRVGPAESISDVELVLAPAGSIVGRAFGRDGRPATNAQVEVRVSNHRFHRSVRTDGEGRFTVEDLAADRYTLELHQLSQSEVQALSGLGYVTETTAEDAGVHPVTVDVPAGAVVEVTLGGGDAAQVRVHGQVVVDGEPLPGARVSATRVGSAGYGSPPTSETDGDGRYSVVLAQPGDYSFRVLFSGGSVRSNHEIPSGQEVALDLVFETGGISGRVTDAAGTPVSGFRVGARSMEDVAGGRGTAVTDPEGRYRVAPLAAGRYAVRGGGARMPWDEQTGPVHGAVVRTGVDVRAGATTEGVDLVVHDGASVRGTATAVDGMPVGQARVFAWNAAGQLVGGTFPWESQGGGAFAMNGLPPGRLTIGVVEGLRASHFRDEVDVEPGATVRIELTLADASVMKLSVEDDGSPAPAVFRVVSRTGLDVSEIVDGRQYGFLEMNQPQTVRRIGPLPPGAYTVTATLPDGRQVTKKVTLVGEAETEVVLTTR
jgi:protocatechuate 3,4-dioxygenase beta subunit